MNQSFLFKEKDRGVIMDENNLKYDLKLILLGAREKKGYSQRKLARIIGIHHSTLNDIENGKIKKIDVEVLRKIAEELDLSLELLLKAAGYNQVVNMFRTQNDPLDKKSTRDLKNMIEKYQQSQMDLLDDSAQKRDNVAKCRTKLHHMMMLLEKYDYYQEIYPTEKILADVKQLYDDLEMSAEKYDYSKLPRGE